MLHCATPCGIAGPFFGSLLQTAPILGRSDFEIKEIVVFQKLMILKGDRLFDDDLEINFGTKGVRQTR